MQISERLGLLHTSQGQEPDRYIEVRKPTSHRREGTKDQQKEALSEALQQAEGSVELSSDSNEEEEEELEGEPHIEIYHSCRFSL
jgi:hypothetical protein